MLGLAINYTKTLLKEEWFKVDSNMILDLR